MIIHNNSAHAFLGGLDDNVAATQEEAVGNHHQIGVEYLNKKRHYKTRTSAKESWQRLPEQVEPLQTVELTRNKKLVWVTRTREATIKQVGNHH